VASKPRLSWPIRSATALCLLSASLLLAQQTSHRSAKSAAVNAVAPPDATHLSSAKSSAIDKSPHQIFFIPVEPGVKLEVLDWGGVGSPVVLLAGLGYDAHVYDQFALKLIGQHHVYGITRRGFGASSAPAPDGQNYSADRLGDDVLAVMDQLRLDRPVLVGHAKAGQELSSIGSREPEKVAGLVYLDAGYSYAFYDARHGDLLLDAIELRNKLDLYLSAGAPDLSAYFKDLQSTLPQFQKDVQDFQDELAMMPLQPPRTVAPPPIMVAIGAGGEKYTEIHAPVLAIFADPHNFGNLFADDPKTRQALILDDFARTSAQADALQAGIPGSHVVRIPNAGHMIFISNEADVLREMNAFMATLQ
jgi:non-heme chloroperoxidase